MEDEYDDPVEEYLNDTQYAYYTDEELAETPAQRMERMKRQNAEKRQTRKGVCPKCGEHIGRGIHFHIKACDA